VIPTDGKNFDGVGVVVLGQFSQVLSGAVGYERSAVSGEDEPPCIFRSGTIGGARYTRDRVNFRSELSTGIADVVGGTGCDHVFFFPLD